MPTILPKTQVNHGSMFSTKIEKEAGKIFDEPENRSIFNTLNSTTNEDKNLFQTRSTLLPTI